MIKLIKRLTIFLSVFSFTVYGALCYYTAKLPDSFYRDTASTKEISLNTALQITAENANAVYTISSSRATFPATSCATLKLMGIIPVKNIEVHDIDVPELIPCGTPFGIKILMDGVMVINTAQIQSSSGYRSPACDAGIEKGDIIKSINDTPVFSNDDITKILSDCKSDGEVKIELLRDGKKIVVTADAVYSSTDGKYELGLWVRDSSAGIGTVTYYNTDNGTFGGLGHPVCDSDTGQILPLSSGEVADVKIRSVKKGKCGCPGELQGYFTDSSPCGELFLNNKFGVFGSMNNPCPDSQKIPMALKQEIKTGKASIYSTLNGCTAKSYDIEICEINYTNTDTSKNMVIKVTDPELLEKSGGIVQGMFTSYNGNNTRKSSKIKGLRCSSPISLTKKRLVFCAKYN